MNTVKSIIEFKCIIPPIYTVAKLAINNLEKIQCNSYNYCKYNIYISGCAMHGYSRLIKMLFFTMQQPPIATPEIMAAWSEWSDWSRTGSCKGTLEPYARSRTCTQLYSTSSPMVTSTVCAENQAQSQVRNATVSSCTGGDSSFIGVALGITSSIALLLIVIGIVLCILSMKLWVRRQSYNIR